MKKVLLLIMVVLLTGLFVGSVYAFAAQPEPPKPANMEDSLVTLPDGSKLEIVQSGKQRLVYLITRKLANGIFTLPDGKKLNISNGVITESK